MRLKVVLFVSLCVLGLIALEIWVFTRAPGLQIKALRMHLSIFMSPIMMVCASYIWGRLRVLIGTKYLFHPGTLFKILMLFLLVMALFISVPLISPVKTNPPVLSLITIFCFGSVLLLTFCMIVADICSFMYRKILLRKNQHVYNRTEIKIRIILSLIGAVFLIISGFLCASNLTIEHVTVPIKGLSSLYNGTTVVQVSDIHLGPFNGRARLRSIVQKVNSLRGDIVVITGDLVDSSVNALMEAVQPLKELRTKYGAYYITGNHEYYTGDVDNWLALIPKLNVTTLVNQRVCLLSKKKSCDGGLYLAGLEDLESRAIRYGAHTMDIHSALSGRTGGVPTVVLAHQPRAAVEALMWKDVRLVLSGHTHAGQILPLMPLCYLLNPFYAGLYEPRDDVYVYVNPGTTYYLVPFRHYRPEITLLTLFAS